jgi:hypothetical protein
MSTLPPAGEHSLPTLHYGIDIAARDLSTLIGQLEQTLTPPQQSLLHKIRLAAEALGAVRALELRLR